MPFIKPENALKRAQEFIDVGKKQRALDTLYDVIKSKSNRTWQKIHEPIMEKYLELCVDLKESHIAKDGLHQYKTISQNVNVKSLEDIINKYLNLAEEQANKAKKDANDATAVDVDDLEIINSPESLLLKAVSGESSQDRADRDVLAPWLKFVWESYKQCLELLKNNNKLEYLYAQVAKGAFQFCAKYNRKTEFRKLCETIRQHMSQSQKYQNQLTSIDLTKPESQSIHLETRLIQLNHAIAMELWQEAYKAVEDIYGLMFLSKTKPKAAQMLNYYLKLSLVFWKAGNHLFHAATLHRLLNVMLKNASEKKNTEELSRISTKVLLATLSVPIAQTKTPIDESLDADEVTIEKNKRLSSLLSLQTPPTRQSLLKDLLKYNVMQYVYPQVKDLFEWLEVEFHPLKLGHKVNQCLEFLQTKNDPDFIQYVPAIKDITVMRLLKLVTQVYTSIEINHFAKLAPAGIDKHHLEKLIVDSVKTNDLQIRINHQTKSLHFGNDLYVSPTEAIQEGPSIQLLPSEQIRRQLVQMSQALYKSVELINKDDLQRKRDELALLMANRYRQIADRHHTDLLKRKQLIEEQKELYERLAVERDQQEQMQRDLEEKRRREEEERKRQMLVEETRKKIDANILKDLGKKAGVEVLDGEQEQKLKQIEQLKKEKKDQEDKLKKDAKRLDHFVRACHEVELPIIIKQTEEDAQARKTYWEQKEAQRIENLAKERKIQAENRERLLRMLPEKEIFIGILTKSRTADYETKLDEFNAKLETLRTEKLAERREQRKIERKQKYYKELEERKKRDEEDKKRREQEEHNRKLAEQAEKQRQRMIEIERKQQEAEKQPALPPRQRQPVSRPTEDENSWRRPLREEEPATMQSRREEDDLRNRASEPYRPRFIRDQQQPAAASRGGEDEWRRSQPPKSEDRDDRRRPQTSSSQAAPKPSGAYRPPQSRAETESSWRRDDRESPADTQRRSGFMERQTGSTSSSSRGGKSYREERSNLGRNAQRENEDNNQSGNDDGWTTVNRGKK